MRPGVVVLLFLLVGVTTSVPGLSSIRADALDIRTAEPIAGLDAEAALRYLAQLPASSRQAIAPYLVEAAVANGMDPTTWPSDRSAVSMLTVTTDATPFQQLLRPLHARQLSNTLDGDPSLLERVRRGFDGGQFGDASLDNDDAWALIALDDDGPSTDNRSQAAARLAGHQHEGGGWSWQVGGRPDVDTTGMVAVALQSTPTVSRLDPQPTVDWLLNMVGSDGGFPSVPGAQSNCDSTVWGLRALQALGRTPPTGPWRFLQSLQNPDGGYAYRLGSASNAMCTAEVATLIGLATKEGWLPRGDLATTTSTTKAAPSRGPVLVPVILMACAVGRTIARRARR